MTRKNLATAPAVNSKWAPIGLIGHTGSPTIRALRVLGCVDGWVVARFKGAAPFLTHQNEWHQRYMPLEDWQQVGRALA